MTIMEVDKKLHDAARGKQHDKWQGQWFLHQETPSHTSFVVQKRLIEKNIPVVTQL
jgi:hypothetical protein